MSSIVMFFSVLSLNEKHQFVVKNDDKCGLCHLMFWIFFNQQPSA